MLSGILRVELAEYIFLMILTRKTGNKHAAIHVLLMWHVQNLTALTAIHIIQQNINFMIG